MNPELLEFIPAFIAVGVLAIIAITFGTIYTTRYKIKHGYPLTGGWGQAVYPKPTREDAERIKLLGQENAQLRAELGAVKDRLATIERIVTDKGYSLTHQIEALRAPPSETRSKVNG